ncbi:MAG: hypothetical protein OHK0052_12580 [Anaerolineales bacterium]
MATRKFPAKFTSLAEIGVFVVRQAEESGLTDEGVYAVQLAVDEACTNIIEHGYAGTSGGEIVCTCEVLFDGLRITLEDRGKFFAPDPGSAPDLKRPLSRVQRRGVGVFLMFQMMDEITYERIGDTNRLTMFKRLAR